MPVLDIEDLTVAYGAAKAVRHVSLSVEAGGAMGVVGESGSGKSTLVQAILGLLPAGARRFGGRIVLAGTELTRLDETGMNRLRGDRVSVVFQDPMSALSPVLSIGRQMHDIQHRRTGSRGAKRLRATEMLARVRVADPERRLRQYPHELSGGMLQRVTVAMALLVEPALLIADEPTTALDATLELEIVELLHDLQRELGCAILFVSHHLGVVAELCRDVAVMYAGEVVERGRIAAVFSDPRHPYTSRLLDCDPAHIWQASRRLPTIPGEVPNLLHLPTGCVFAPRCDRRFQPCDTAPPPPLSAGPEHMARCYLLSGPISP